MDAGVDRESYDNGLARIRFRPARRPQISEGSMFRTSPWQIVCALFVVLVICRDAGAEKPSTDSTDGWTAASPRPEIFPDFPFSRFTAGSEHFQYGIQHDGREGLDGYWTKTFPVEGTKWYR